MTQPPTTHLYKALNALILISLITLPILLYITAANISGLAQTLQITDTNQTYTKNSLTMTATVKCTNPGPFPATASLKATLKDTRGTQLPIQGPTIQLPPGKQKVPVELTVDITHLAQEDLEYLAQNPEEITLTAEATISLQPVASIKAEATALIRWLPPIHELTIGEPEITSITPTKISVDIPLSFENQSPFELNALAEVTITDSSNKKVGGGEHNIQAPPSTKYSQPIQLTITPPENADPLTDQTYTYTATSKLTLTDYSIPLNTEPRQIQIEWGALIKNPELSIKITPIDISNSQVVYEITYTNNNQYLPLDASITPKIMKGSETIGTGTTENIHTTPLSQGRIQGQLTLPNSAILQGGLRLVLKVTNSYGSYELEVGTLD